MWTVPGIVVRGCTVKRGDFDGQGDFDGRGDFDGLKTLAKIVFLCCK